MNRGIAFGVGVGPGDPELMTLKACRLIRENEVIAVPGKIPQESVAYRIAAAAVPELSEKKLLPVYMPMVKDRTVIKESHAKAAALLESYLDSGRNVVYLTLGDSTIYCTFSYIQHILEADGYEVELVSGIPSFCAAAARLGVSLTEWNESLHVMPALHNTHEETLEWPGNYVLMKSASRMPEVKKMLSASGYDVIAAENCSMESEKLYRSVDEIPDDAGYFTLIIARENKESSI
jgi:precorrin-2/cobalt-factor-2 C20-methyltransferase